MARLLAFPPCRRCECAGDKGRLLDDLLLDLAASGEGTGDGISGKHSSQPRSSLLLLDVPICWTTCLLDLAAFGGGSSGVVSPVW